MGLILVGVVLMLASGVDPLAHGGDAAVRPAAIPADSRAGNPQGFLWLGLVARARAARSGGSSSRASGSSRRATARLALVSLAVLLVVLGVHRRRIGLEG